MKILKNNKLIAEFLGYIDNGCSEDGFLIHPITNYDVEISSLKYHEDWNWLMEVVEKIESLGYRIEIVKHICRIYLSNKETIIISENTPKIEAVYIACVEFIKWYNNQNKVS